jgi:peptidoglycan/LPS O-acetylase OafA/YrhL
MAPIVGFIGLVGFLISGLVSGSFETSGRLQMIFGLPCITLFFAALLVMAIRPGIVKRCAEAAWLRWLGGISYGIYVFHMLFLNIFVGIAHKIVGHRSQTVTNAVLFVVAASGSIASAWLSFHFFERPFLKLKDRFTSHPVHTATEVSL